MGYKAICFDIDGTLYPPKTMHRRLLRLYIRHPFYSSRYNKERAEFRKYQDSFKQDTPLRWREAMIIRNGIGKEPEAPFSDEEYRGEYRELHRRFYDPMGRMYRKTVPFEGVRQTFEKIKAKGLKIGVFTDWPLYSKLQSLGLADLVDFACSSDDAGFLKPDTHCFEYLLYNLNVRPEDALYVGDSYKKDVAGAAGAGMDGVLVNVRRSDLADSGSKYPLAKAVFSDWKDFDAWLCAGMEDD
ncbi:MAG: HAD family hydrolase [Spirochaetales bacterium]|nr:HAD family hydrolase [Spirochaetales bacterium]